jgi:histidyl-tRNA synthetase
MQLAKGVRDVPPEEKMVKNRVLRTITETYELFGFAPLETPIIERMETLAAKGGAGRESDAVKEIFKLSDQGNRKLGLRFDLTVPLCRFIAMNPTLKLPFKRYQLGRVFRDGPIKLGRYREFWQCDADVAGTSSMLADAECIAIAATTFKSLGLDVILKVNNRKILNGILEQVGVRNGEEAIIAIDKLTKIGKGGVEKELQDRGYTKKQSEQLFKYIKEGVTLRELKKKITNDRGKEGINELEELFSYLKQMGIKSTTFDVSLARGLGYYTGTVFEVFLKKGKITSSLAAGGRYDNLVAMLGGRDIPAVGFSFGIEPIVDTLLLQNNDQAKTPTKVYVIPINTTQESLQVAQQLRNAGISTSLSMGKKGVSKNLQYASALQIPYVIIVGPEELKKNKLLLRGMQSGEEQVLSLQQVIKRVK